MQVLNADANKSDPNGQSIHLTTYNNISINLQLCWIFKSVLELIECDRAYFLICNRMMWHVEIEGVKLRFTIHPYRISLSYYRIQKYSRRVDILK